MDLGAVMDELADQLDTIAGLRVFAYPPDKPPAPPAAIVAYPDTYAYDVTYARGLDRLELPVVVVVGKVSDRSARDHLSQYVDGSGSASIKEVLESGTYTTCDTVRVTGAEFDVIGIGAIEYLSARFTVDIAGQGEA